MNDPKRLILTESNELGLAVASARRQLPNDEQVAALATRLAQLGAPIPPESGLLAPKGGPSESAAGAAPAAWGPLAKISLGLLTGLGVIAALVFGLARPTLSPSTTPPAPSNRASEASAPESSSAAQPSSSAAPTGAHGRRESGRHEFSPQDSGHQEKLPVQTAAGVSATSVSPGPAPSLKQPTAPSVTPRGPSERTLVSPDVSQADARARSDSRSQPAGRRDSFDDPAALHGRVATSSEIELLKQARAALSGDPLQAYVLTERCRAEYPRGTYAQERDFIAITALLRVGRSQQARAQATLFRTHYPRSAYLPQLDRMFEEP